MAVLFLNNAAWADASLYKGRDKIGVVKSLNSNSKLYVSAQDVAAIFGFRSSYSNEELVLSNGRSQIRILMNSAAAWRDNSLISLSSVPFEQDGTCWLDTSSVTTLFQRMAGAGQQNKLRFAASSSSSYANNKQDIIINPQPVITPQANANNDNNIIRDNERITRPEPVILPPVNNDIIRDEERNKRPEPVILPPVNNDIIKDEERNKRPEPIILPPEDSSQIIIAPKPERKPEEFKSDSSTLINNPEEFLKRENSRPRQENIKPQAQAQNINLNLGEIYRVRWSFTNNHNRIRAVIDASDKAEPVIKINNDGTASALFASSKSVSIEGGVSPYENLNLSAAKTNNGVELLFKADAKELKKVERLILSSPRRIVFDFFFNHDAVIRRARPQAQVQPEINAPAQVPAPVIKNPVRTGRKIVVVDPGHGGKDPGTAANGVTEKNVNLAVGLLLERELKSMGFDVVMTRRTDVYLKLQERTDIANKAKADVFVSVHVNALPSAKKTSGFEIYIMALPTDKDALNLAKIENREYVEGKANNNSAEVDKRTELLLRILGDMQQNNKINESTELAEALFKAGNSSSLPMKRVAQAPFFVLRGAGMPAVLLETGFVTNETEAKLLAHPGYQERIAKAMAAGVADYLQ